MRLQEKKDKNSVPLKISGIKSHLTIDNKKEEQYLKYAVHLLTNDLPKAVYRLDTGYLFVRKNDDEIIVEPKELPDESEAKFEIDSFFEGRSAEVFDDSDVDEIKKSLFSDKRFVLALVIIALPAFFYAVLKITEPIKYISKNTPATPLQLTDKERGNLTVAGTRKVAKNLAEIISTVRADKYARIAGLSVQQSVSQQSVSYVASAGTEYQYPVIGSVSKTPGVWGKTLTDTISLDRKDIVPLQSNDFDDCALQLLNNGFYVQQRDDKCVSLIYEGDSTKIMNAYNSNLLRCNAALTSMNISEGKGKLDVKLCKQ